ncbi:MAG: 4-hydroxy-tetrahydrodipicolinate reductase [Myxococcota bacterium]|jgi:4-hydroxy-tetrahydrodipicolinate reductase
MGRAIVSAVNSSESATLGGVWERPGFEGWAAPFTKDGGLTLETGPEALVGAIDVVIDFTAPAATVRHAEWCAANGVAFVTGTTGLSADDTAQLAVAAESVAVVVAANMSVGVNVLAALVEQAARMLGSQFDLEVVETHHRKKRDAPSGTALRLVEALQAGRTGKDGPLTPVFERYGDIGPRTADEIGVQTLRGGDVVGEHTVFYYGDGERIELTHRATDRGVFASGAVRAALWAAGQSSGYFSMADVLGAN